MIHERVAITSDDFIIHGFYECIINNSDFFKTQKGEKVFSSSSFKMDKIQLLTYWFFTTLGKIAFTGKVLAS